MYVHHFLRTVYEEGANQEEDQSGGILSSLNHLKSYVFSYSPKPFYYNIGGFNFNLDELKHGLLRCNQKAPYAYMRSMNSNDNRLNILNGCGY